MNRLRKDMSGVAKIDVQGERATVQTAHGTRYPFRRRDNGIWGLTLFTATLSAEAEKAARDLALIDKAASDYEHAAKRRRPSEALACRRCQPRPARRGLRQRTAAAAVLAKNSLLSSVPLAANYLSPASFRYHPTRQAAVQAEHRLSDGRLLLAGKRGERWLVDPGTHRSTAAANLAPEDLIAVLDARCRLLVRGPERHQLRGTRAARCFRALQRTARAARARPAQRAARSSASPPITRSRGAPTAQRPSRASAPRRYLSPTSSSAATAAGSRWPSPKPSG